MRFWDTSAIAALLIREPLATRAVASLEEDRSLTVWWATPVECLSAVVRAERDGRLASDGVADAVAALRLLRSGWSEVDPSSRLRLLAERIVRTHPLRAADAFQLAAAIVAAEDAPSTMPFVTLDDRLAIAAVREGFPVIRFDQP